MLRTLRPLAWSCLRAAEAAGEAASTSGRAPGWPWLGGIVQQRAATTGQTSAPAGAPAPIHAGAQAVIHISATKNNTILALQDLKGDKKAGTSAGTVGYKKARRKSPVGAADAAAALVQKARDMGINTVAVKIKGIGVGREAALSALVTAGMNLTKIVDATPVPHNGCRPPKKRRI